MSDYRSLEVWRRAHDLRLAVYRVTDSYPPHELFALTSQTRRATASIAANIAEGAGRGSRPDYARFLNYALGSVNEAEDHLVLARDLRYLAHTDWVLIADELAEVRRMLGALRKYLVKSR